jgi:S1-C subfamily serine protease
MMAPMAGQKKNLYEILGVPRDANSLDIGLAYQRRTAELQRAVPPDPGAASFVHQAHEILSNPQRRAAYDASLVTAAEKAAAAEQQEPDLVLEGGEEEAKPRPKYLAPGIGVVTVLVIAIFFAMRSHAPEAPKPVEPVVAAPKPPPPPPPPQPLGPEQILPAALQSVGRVMSYEMSGRAVPLGMALATEPGTMITTCHGIPGGSQLVVRVGADSNSANLTVTDEVLDLCKLAIAGLNARALPIAPDEPRPGDKVFALGVNAKGDFALTEGTVKVLRPSPQGKVIEISVPIAPGGSGGAVFDTYGRVVGIATTPHNYGAGLNIAIPSSLIETMRTRERAAAAPK